MLITNIAKVILVNPNLKKLLLIKRSQSDERRPGQWDLPGGMVEYGETIEHGAIRETEEEAGINISIDSLKLIYTINNIQATNKRLTNWLIFTANTTKTEVKLSNEHDEYSWYSIKEALDLIIYERHKIVLDLVFKEKIISELFD